jgi:hypothetical protein
MVKESFPYFEQRKSRDFIAAVGATFEAVL